jgi:hypothetical protein
LPPKQNLAALKDGSGNNHILPPNECYPKAQQFAQKALEIDDKLAVAYCAYECIKQNYE